MTTKQLDDGNYLESKIGVLRIFEKDLNDDNIFHVIRGLKSNDLLEKSVQEEIKKLLSESINRQIEINTKEFESL